MSSLESSHPALSAAPDVQLPSDSKAFPFLRLPPETRNQIYHELLVKPGPQAIGELSTSYPAQDIFENSGVDSDTASNALFFSDLRQYRQSAFTGACRLLHSEATAIFYSSNVFSFTKASTFYAFLRHLTALSRLSLQNIRYSRLQEFHSGDLMAALIYLRALCPAMHTLELIYRMPEMPEMGNLCRDFSMHDVLGWLHRLPYEERIDDEEFIRVEDYYTKEQLYRTHEGVKSRDLGRSPVFEPPVVSVRPWSRERPPDPWDVRWRSIWPWSTVACEKRLCQRLLAQAREGGEKIVQEMKSITKGDLAGFKVLLEKIDAYRERYQVYPPGMGTVARRDGDELEDLDAMVVIGPKRCPRSWSPGPPTTCRAILQHGI